MTRHLIPRHPAKAHRGVWSDAERERVLLEELPQVRHIARRIHERLPRHVPLEDLVHAGVLGLIDALNKFDLSKRVQFSSYAKFRIRGAILDSLRELDWGSRLMRRRGREIAEATARLEGRLGRKPAEAEIAREMQLDLEHYRKIVAQLDNLHITGQQVIRTEDNSETVDLIESAPSLDDPNPFDLCLKGEMKSHLAEAIGRLTEREQLILSLYYREELTMKEIAKVVGVALSRVSQIKEAAIVKLRKSLAHVQERQSANPSELEGSFA